MESEATEGRSATESERPDVGFEIDGERYAIPPLDSFDLDECQILYDVAGVLQEDFEPSEPEASEEERKKHAKEILRKIASPAFKRALAEVAYRRKHPEVTASLRSELVGKANALDVTIALILGGDPDNPPESSSPNELENVRSINELLRSEASGNPSGSDSTGLDSSRATTGVTA